LIDLLRFLRVLSVTSVAGHVYSTDFPPEFQSWDSVDPLELFEATTKKVPADKGGKICRHLQTESRGCDYLVLWLDCDREGENICFEVIENSQPWLNKVGKSEQQVFRAKFSALTLSDIQRAMSSLVEPNLNESLSVDARQILDLKVGVAFTRFQTKVRFP
jgi:DNA topoisomerase-3